MAYYPTTTHTRNGVTLTKSIAMDGGGVYAEIYDEDSDMIGHWYGPTAECLALDPFSVELHPRKDDSLHSSEHSNGVDPFDLACERRFD